MEHLDQERSPRVGGRAWLLPLAWITSLPLHVLIVLALISVTSADDLDLAGAFAAILTEPWLAGLLAGVVVLTSYLEARLIERLWRRAASRSV